MARACTSLQFGGGGGRVKDLRSLLEEGSEISILVDRGGHIVEGGA